MQAVQIRESECLRMFTITICKSLTMKLFFISFFFFLFAFFKQLRRHWLRKAQDEKLLVIMVACYI